VVSFDFCAQFDSIDSNERLASVGKPTLVDEQAGESVMTGGNSGPAPCVVVVGGPCSEFVRTTVRLAREYEIEAVQCDDVYSAVAATAQAVGRPALVFGQMRDLARENGRFFEIAAANATCCCCVLEEGGAMCREGILPAVRAGASILGHADQMRGVLEQWLADSRRRSPRGRLGDLFSEDLRATEAELRALLGQDADD